MCAAAHTSPVFCCPGSRTDADEQVRKHLLVLHDLVIWVVNRHSDTHTFGRDARGGGHWESLSWERGPDRVPVHR